MTNVFQNLTFSHNSSKGRDPCPSAKVSINAIGTLDVVWWL